MLKHLVDIGAGPKDALVMDFFAGSGSLADAVFQKNQSDEGTRCTVSVQMPFKTDRKDFPTISSICEARLKAALKRDYGENYEDEAKLRVFRLKETSLRKWNGVAHKDPDAYAAQLEAFTDSLAPGWQPQDVIWEVALREGYSLTAKVEELDIGTGPTLWRVSDEDRSFTICLDEALTLDAVTPLGLTKDDMFVCRDTALDDTLAANLALQCRLKVI